VAGPFALGKTKQNSRFILESARQIVIPRMPFWLAVAPMLLSEAASCAATVTFSNAALITINDSMAPPTAASMYPSPVTVTGLTGQVITKLTVTIYGFTHGFPSDVDILLVGPQGQNSLLMANAGGQNKYSVTNLVLTFDDDAGLKLPIFTGLVSGTFKPTDGYAALGYSNLPFEFPLPAPPGNSNSSTALSVFSYTDPNGVWKLFVVDDVSGDGGTISGGWSLSLSVAVPLRIARVETNSVISWTGAVTNYSLQSSSGLSTQWNHVTNVPVLSGGRYYVTNAMNGSTRFYRLLQQTP
jgi:subtilisin-like proprotein convertase family protein